MGCDAEPGATDRDGGVGPTSRDGGALPPDGARSRHDGGYVWSSGCARAATYVIQWSLSGGGLAGAEVLGALIEGQVATVHGHEGDWLDVEHDGVRGWSRVSAFAPAECDEAPREPAPRTDARKVVAVFFVPRDPTTGRPIHEVFNWGSPEEYLVQALAWWEEVSEGRLVYRVTETIRWEEFPIKEDGYRYDYDTWVRTVRREIPHHEPDISDYPMILERSGLCDRVNAGEADELWMFGAPYMGFGESALAGPGVFPYNGPGYDNNSCERLVPIMGFNYERTLTEMLHNWGHRIEATMTHLFGDWQEDRLEHDWDRFGLTYVQSPGLGFAGCGSVHYPPNAAREYEYDHREPRPSMCADFDDYPELAADPTSVLAPVDCTAWACTQIGYLQWWLSHLPSASGTKNGISNDWWSYLIDPGQARSCESFAAEGECAAVSHCEWVCGDCYRLGVDPTAACSHCGQQHTLPDCNEAGGCAWYACAPDVACWPTGTSLEDVCG